MADLIDRQAAIDAVRHSPIIEVQPAYMLIDKADVLKNLVMLPSAQRTGRWIDGKVKHIKNGELRNVRECSECGSSYFVYDCYNRVDEIPKFCPNCGARMEEQE